MMKRYGALMLPLALAACSHAAGGSAASSTQPQQPVTAAAVGKPAPDFTEPLAEGGTLAMTSLKGKAVYLNFFASWCPPCNEEATDINAVSRQYAKQGLDVVGVDVLENAKKARSFIDEHHLTYPAVVDDGALRDAYNIDGMPEHVFIDRSGIVRKIVVGELTKAQMEADVKSVL